ncbi:MAG: toxin-antitoxin system YwqK family antitoxin [Pirellulales bacterium]
MHRFYLARWGTAAILAVTSGTLWADDTPTSEPATAVESSFVENDAATTSDIEVVEPATDSILDQLIEEPTDAVTAPVAGAEGEAATLEPAVAVVDGVVEVEAPAVDADAPQEVIKERYPNRAIKVERHVVQDAAGNYVNQGLWTMWDEHGRIIGRGEFQRGQREGTWTRWYAPKEGEMFGQAPYKHFEAPFTAEVGQKHNKLHGDWTVYDAKNRKISQWAFENGERHGRSTWYYPNGRKLRECTYLHGELDGEVFEWEADGKLGLKETYQLGRRVGRKTERYSPKLVKSEGDYLFARDLSTPAYDWWRGEASNVVKGKDGKDVRHGAYTSWHKNGQKLMEGHYEEGQPIGTFTWWHPNGQQSVSGSYEHGRPVGEWTWWHPNGQKAIAGGYVDGGESGRWMWWKEDGKLANVAEYSEHSEAVVSTMPASEKPPAIVESDDPPVAHLQQTASPKSPRKRHVTTEARKPNGSSRRLR